MTTVPQSDEKTDPVSQHLNDKEIPSRVPDDHQTTTTNGKHLGLAGTIDKKQQQLITDEKSSPVSDSSDSSNVKSSTDKDSIKATVIAGGVGTGLPASEVMDSARDRFEQFWSKPTSKYEVNGKESSM